MIVVGGGVAGAEAAFRTADSGSLVTLIEGAGQIGGWGRGRRQPPAPTAGGGTVLVVDDEGGFVAPTAAASLVAAGWKVRIATSLPHVAALVDPTQVWFVGRRLKLADVELIDT